MFNAQPTGTVISRRWREEARDREREKGRENCRKIVESLVTLHFMEYSDFSSRIRA